MSKLRIFWYIGALLYFALGASNFMSYGADPTIMSRLIFAVLNDIIAVGWVLVGVEWKSHYKE